MVTDLSWLEKAACAGYDPEWWFPRTSNLDTTVTAVLICRSCPVREQCLDFALAHDLGYGIFAGTFREDRKTLRARRGIRKGRDVIYQAPCGTPAAFRRHQRHGEIPCGACTDAVHAYDNERWKARRQSQPGA